MSNAYTLLIIYARIVLTPRYIECLYCLILVEEVIYLQILSSEGICLWPSLNNVAEYGAVIELLRDAISHGILSLEVRLDSELVVSQINGLYHVRDMTLLRRFLRVRLLERQFDHITFQEIIIKLLTHMLTTC